jgi:phage baseplate assembly protein gpV
MMSAHQPIREWYLSEMNYIGEFGLNSSRDGGEKIAIQSKSFHTVLRKAGGDKIFSLHARMAEEQVLDMLLDSQSRCGIFHLPLVPRSPQSPRQSCCSRILLFSESQDVSYQEWPQHHLTDSIG